jgi:dienelactone hydrolase
MRLSGALAIALAAFSASIAQAASVEKHEVTVGAAKVPFWISFPDKPEGKLPAIIILHGSGGVSKRFWDYASEFNKLGLAAVIIDSFNPRGVRSTVIDQRSVTANDMAKDALTILQVLAKDDRIDGHKVGAIGFSKGGSALLNRASLAFTNKKGDVQLALMIAMYPSCGSFRLHPRTTGRPIRVLVGDKDTYTNPSDCRQVAERYKKDGADIEIVTLPGGQHGWDAPGHFKIANGQNWSLCRFDEIKPRVWVERSTQLVIEDEHGPNKNNYDKAAAKCMTYGVSGGYNARAAAESFKLIKAYISAFLK